MRKLSNIQVLRGLAALAVVVFHAREELDGVGIGTAIPSLLGGAFGVDVFFVISGFVMVYASVPLFGAWRSALPFMAKRLARIVPLYWACTVLFAFVTYGQADPMSNGGFARFLATSLFFVPYLQPVGPDAFPVYPLGWTLDYEMFFYACFALVLGLPRRSAIAVLTAGFVGLVAVTYQGLLTGRVTYLGSSQILEFVAGMLLAQAALAGRRLPRASAGALVAAGVAAMLLAAPWSDAWWGHWRGIAWGLPATAIVAGMALCPPIRDGGPLRQWFERLGDASYALYLVHYGLYVAIDAALGSLFDLTRVPAPAYMLVLVGSAVAAAFAVHRAFEVPVTRALQRRFAPGQRPSLAVSEP